MGFLKNQQFVSAVFSKQYKEYEIEGRYNWRGPPYQWFYMLCRRFFICIKVLMQGKLIAVAYTLRTYWNQFSLGGICKQESEEDKSI